MIDPVLLEILRCPFHPESDRLVVRGELLICPVDGAGFRILDGIPDMLPEDLIPPEQVRQILQEQENGKSTST